MLRSLRFGALSVLSAHPSSPQQAGRISVAHGLDAHGCGRTWQHAGVMTQAVVKGLIDRDARGRLTLTDHGRAVLRALLPGL
jgi:hypothetical protein